MGNETLIKIWKKLDLNKNSLPERIQFQKTIYILQKLGFKGLEKYDDYGMYIYGPYSTKLAKDIFETKNEDLKNEFSITEKENSQIKIFEDIINGIGKNENEPPSVNYEMVADILYLVENNKIENIFEILKNKHKYLDNKEKFKLVINKLNEHKLLQN